MRVLIDTPDTYVLTHSPWIEIIVHGVIWIFAFAFVSVRLYVFVHVGVFLPEMTIAGLFVVVIPFLVFRSARFVVAAFDRQLDSITISRRLLWIQREESYRLSDLYSVHVERQLVVLQFNRNLPKYQPVSWLDAGIERIVNYWWVPLQRNQLALMPYETGPYGAELCAAGIRDWAGVGKY